MQNDGLMLSDIKTGNKYVLERKAEMTLKFYKMVKKAYLTWKMLNDIQTTQEYVGIAR